MKFTKPQLKLLEGLARLHTDSHLVGAPPDGRVRLAAYNRRLVSALVDKHCVAYHVGGDPGEWFALTIYGFRIAQCWIRRKERRRHQFIFATHGTTVTMRRGQLPRWLPEMAIARAPYSRPEIPPRQPRPR